MENGDYIPVILDPLDAHWIAYMNSQTKANIFHHPVWINLLANCYGYRPFIFAIRNRDHDICAGFPMMEIRNILKGHQWKSLPFTDHCTPLYSAKESFGYLIESLIDLYQKEKIPKIELRCELSPNFAFHMQTQYVLHTLELSRGADMVASRFHATHRRNIKVAKNRGVRIEYGVKPEHIKAFYDLHVQSRSRLGIPVQPWKFFELLGRTVIEPGLGFVLLAYMDKECLAGAIFLHWHQTLTYKYGASRINGQKFRPNNLLFWTAIRWGCENGFNLFDLGRTDCANNGLRTFKSGWGAAEIPLAYSFSSSGSSLPSTDKAVTILKSIIRKSPDWVCRIVGELFYRHFG